MQPPNWTEFLQCCICTNKFDSQNVIPISLSCGHTLCAKCLTKLMTKVCPYDKNPIGPLVDLLPKNYAILHLVESVPSVQDGQYPDLEKLGVKEEDKDHFLNTAEALDKLAEFLLPLADQSATNNTGSHLTKPMLRKLVSIVTSQVLESEGRGRMLKAARSIADRTVTELLVMHQNQQQLSTQLWTSVKTRGCQFLGPVMQEEALKLVLMVLQSGKFMARKTIVLYVVQKLLQDFPQASKTSVGHVVQLLYRASCFNVEKREDDSSLMQLKEEFRSYELLRREHDAQIIRMAMEAGLRISPEQWSSLLYGNPKHKSDMQSIIDKLISQGATSTGLSELIVAIGRSQDPYNLSEKIVPHLESLLNNNITNNEKCTELANSWSDFSECMCALHSALQGFSTFIQIQSGRFKTGLCPNLDRPEGCPKGDKCTYAHTEEEREHYRILSKGTKPPKARTEPVKMGGAPSRIGQGSRARHSGDLGPVLSDVPVYSYMPSTGRIPPREGPYLRQGSREGSFDSGMSAHSFPANYQYAGAYAAPDTPVLLPTTPTHEAALAAPKPPVQFYTPTPAPHYHTVPVVTAPQDVLYEGRSVVTDNQSYYMYRDQETYPSNEVVGHKNYSDEKPYQGTGYHGYSSGSSNQPSLNEQYLEDARGGTTQTSQEDTAYSEWSQYSSGDSFPKDNAESQAEGSNSMPPRPHSGQGYDPSFTTTNETLPEQKPPVVAGTNPELLQEKMAALSIGTTAECPSSTSYPLTTAVITSVRSRTNINFEGQNLDSIPRRVVTDSHSTLPQTNPDLTGYPPQHYSSMTSSGVRTVPSQSTNPIPSVSNPVPPMSRGSLDLQERKLQLERELRMIELEQQQQQQQAASRWSGPKTVYPATQVRPRVPYEGTGGASPNHSGLVQQPHHYSGPVQYSPHATMQHQYVPAQPSLREYQLPNAGPSPSPQAGMYYSPQPTPSPHHWSGPLSGPPSGRYVAPLQQPGYVIQPQPAAAGGLLMHPSRLEPPDDGMIAAYLQALEQEKAASGHGYQHTYTAPISHNVGGYQAAAIPPRQQYPGNYKYTY